MTSCYCIKSRPSGRGHSLERNRSVKGCMVGARWGLRVKAVRLEGQEAVKDPGRSPASLRGGRVPLRLSGGASVKKTERRWEGIFKSQTWKGKCTGPCRETQRSSWGRWACRSQGWLPGDRPWDDVLLGTRDPMMGADLGGWWCRAPPSGLASSCVNGQEALLWKGAWPAGGYRVALELGKRPGPGGMCSGT